MITAGIDIGSMSTKSALLRDGQLVGSRVIPTGYSTKTAALRVFEELLSECSVCREDVSFVVSTGYGRNSVDFADRAVTEITCHARGAHFQDNTVRAVIDIGGQDSKAIVLNHDGRVLEFAMNDKCAAGTGRFLEVMARALEVDLDDFGEISLKAEYASSISSLCTVFAESEVISLIARGEKRQNIIKGIHESIAARVTGMIQRIGVSAPIMMTGGVSRNMGVVRALEAKMNTPIVVSDLAQVNGALGAALIAESMV